MTQASRPVLQAMKDATLQVAYEKGVALESVYIWLDCLSIPQANAGLKTAAINCIYSFATVRQITHQDPATPPF